MKAFDENSGIWYSGETIAVFYLQQCPLWCSNKYPTVAIQVPLKQGSVWFEICAHSYYQQ